jgi:hypothetical protein
LERFYSQVVNTGFRGADATRPTPKSFRPKEGKSEPAKRPRRGGIRSGKKKGDTCLCGGQSSG